ncbi:hypothetical protein KSP39_PZI013739 [Platanthera zijinensis]|uniref:Uncharacterized protein n=1 Tax=Platanthera zijinensis TaxID=2320716 RepID=A0AAP0G402_9ASPA
MASPPPRLPHLSRFYCWPEDIPAALSLYPLAAGSLSHLNLLCSSTSEGFRSSELVGIASACPNLRRLLAPCVFNPRFFDCVGDDALLAVASHCSRISLLHLADPSTLSPSRAIINSSAPGDESRVTRAGLDSLFSALPLLEDLTLDSCHDVPDSGAAFECLSYRCPRIRSLKLGCFQGICKAAGLHLDGVALCGALQNLCIKNSNDLSDSSLAVIARGCRQLSRFEIHGCDTISETGIKRFATILRSTLKEVRISSCRNLDASSCLRALEPIRDRIVRLHIDCIWANPGASPPPIPAEESSEEDDLELEPDNNRSSKRCKSSDHNNGYDKCDSDFWCRTFERLRNLSLWIPAGEVLSLLPEAGLESCPKLEEINIKVEGDCRTCPLPSQPVFGLSTLALYPQLSKMKLDCGEAIGYALTAPRGHMDLSLWERFYLHGIGDLNLYELDYWPPQDKEVNQRTLSLPASGLIQGCLSLRKLFIHGTAHEHFMRFFLGMANLRDVQLREDYYPAPDHDMSTEMRVDSCSRFEDALNSRFIPD